jgi:hypothetical protein
MERFFAAFLLAALLALAAGKGSPSFLAVFQITRHYN